MRNLDYFRDYTGVGVYFDYRDDIALMDESWTLSDWTEERPTMAFSSSRFTEALHWIAIL